MGKCAPIKVKILGPKCASQGLLATVLGPRFVAAVRKIGR